jgi:O-antigen ligase
MNTATTRASGETAPSTMAPAPMAPLGIARHQRTQQWVVAIALGIAMIMVEIDPGAVGLTILQRVGRLGIGVAVTAPFVVFVLARATRWWPMMMTAPLGIMVTWQMWSLITGLMVERPSRAVGLSLGAIGLVISAGWLGSMWPWERTLRLIASVVGLMCLASTVLQFAGRSGRWVGVLPDWNGLGRLGAFAAVSGVALWWQGGWARMGGAIGAVSGVLCVWGSDSRMALVAMGFGGVVLGARVIGTRPAVAAAMVVAAIGVAVVGGAIQGTPTVSRDDEYRDVSSASGRTTIWPVALNEMLDHPLTGRGTGSLETVYDEALADGRVAWRAFNAHNVALNVGVAHGVVGLAMFIAFAGSLLVSAIRRPLGSRDALLAVIFAIGLTEGVIDGPGLALAIIALVAGHHVAARAAAPRPFAWRSCR